MFLSFLLSSVPCHVCECGVFETILAAIRCASFAVFVCLAFGGFFFWGQCSLSPAVAVVSSDSLIPMNSTVALKLAARLAFA